MTLEVTAMKKTMPISIAILLTVVAIPCLAQQVSTVTPPPPPSAERAEMEAQASRQKGAVVVRILFRETFNYQTGVTYSGSASTNCQTYGSNTNCQTTGHPGGAVTFPVMGDRIAFFVGEERFVGVQCLKPGARLQYGPLGRARDCKQPLGEYTVAEFHGDKVKLSWPVSTDGKKWESETYKILASVPITSKDVQEFDDWCREQGLQPPITPQQFDEWERKSSAKGSQ